MTKHHSRNKSHSRSRSPKRDRHHGSKKQKKSTTAASLDLNQLENEAAYLVATEIKEKIKEEVRKYVETDDYKALVDAVKRKERERILKEVADEMQLEKEALLTAERRKHQDEILQEKEAKEILLQNRLVVEELQRKEFEDKQRADAQRLEEIQRKVQREQFSRDKIVSFGLKKK